MLNQKEKKNKHLISRNTKNYFEFSFNYNRIEKPVMIFILKSYIKV